MIDTVRILITRDCNFDCSYCCNKFPELTNEIKSSTMQQLLLSIIDINKESPIKNIVITGGEPFINRHTFVTILDLIHTIGYSWSVNFYIYTNGSSPNIVQMISQLKDSTFGYMVKGINISYHREHSESFPTRTKIEAINEIYPVTLRVEKSCLELPMPSHYYNHTVGSQFEQLFEQGYIKDYRVFELNDCKRDNEIIYELKQ